MERLGSRASSRRQGAFGCERRGASGAIARERADGWPADGPSRSATRSATSRPRTRQRRRLVAYRGPPRSRLARGRGSETSLARRSGLAWSGSGTGLHSTHGAGARAARRFRASARAAAAADRLDRPGRARGARGDARQALDQARVEGLRARARRAHDRPDDARGRGHARQGRRARVEGDAARPDRRERALGRRALRLPEPRARPRSSGSRGSGVKVASVATAFPSGQAPIETKLEEVALGRRAGRRRGRHGHRPRRLPLRPLREGLRRDRAREGSVAATRT